MNEDLKKSLVGLAIGTVLVIFGYFSHYLKNNDKDETKTKQDKIKKGLQSVSYANYLSKGIIGIIFIIISIIFFIKYLISLL